MRVITPDYFKTMKIPLRAGRLFDAHDDDAAPEVVIINERGRAPVLAGRNPIGQQLRLGVRLVREARSGRRPSSASSAT